MPNELKYEKSPYLLQHKDNPVDWQSWGPKTFQMARMEDKPIFLSIGYSTCHWCHVMAHESFEDREAAEAINSTCVPIKVDREERADVDAVYMAACLAMNGSGGWPLTVLLTPDQKPFWAGTYLPKEGLLSLLRQVRRLWKEDRGRLLEAGEELTAHLRQTSEARPGAPRRTLAEEGAAGLARAYDPRWGGFGQVPKFPTPHNLIFLLRYAALTGETKAGEMAERTLEHMYRGGLFDHVGGGFARYSTDRAWLAPHFEKMLYDNALLALAYVEAYQDAKEPYCRAAAGRSLDYVLRELTAPRAAFTAARTPTATVWRESSTSSRRRSSGECWGLRRGGPSAAGSALRRRATLRAGAFPTSSARPTGTGRSRGWTGCGGGCMITGGGGQNSTGTTRFSPPGTAL